MEPSCEEDKGRQILDILLKILPNITQSHCDIASMQQACSAWREVLRCAATRSANIRSRSLTDPAAVQSFSSWLSAHAELLRSLIIDRDPWARIGVSGPQAGSAGGSSSSSDTSSSGSSSSSSSTEAAIAASLTAAAAAPGGLQLQRFSSNYLYSPSFLSALPAASLQQLDLPQLLGHPQHSPNHPGFTAALSRLTALQTLILGKADSYSLSNGSTDLNPAPATAAGSGAGSTADGGLSCTLLSTLGSMRSLRELALQGAVLSAAEAVQLPTQLTRLVLAGCKLPLGLDLAHMGQLLALDLVGPEVPQHPTLEASEGTAATALLPPSLTSLTLLSAKHRHGHLTTHHLTALQQLQLLDCRETPGGLLQLGTIPTLKALKLRYLFWKPLLAAAPAWAHLPQLQTLDLCGVDLRQPWQLDLITSSLAAATTLTCVTMTKLFTRQPVKICAALQDLPRLESLAFDCVQLAKGDPLAVTRLTGLTSLSVVNCSSAVDDVAAVAICLHLTGLHSLKLVSQGLGSMGLLHPAALGLKGLHNLCISGRSSSSSSGSGSCCVDEVSLGMLSSLIRLTHLSLPGNPASLAAVQGLRRALPGLEGVTITPV